MISIIIPTFNKASRLKVCLYFLSKIRTDYKMEIIIVDDGSNDDTDNIIREQINSFDKKCNIKIIKIINSGRAYARNIGVMNATYDILLFLDDDMIINKQIIESHIKLHNNSKMVVRGKILHLPYMKAFIDPCILPNCNMKLKEIYANMAIDFNRNIDKNYLLFNKYSKESKFEKLVHRCVLNDNYFKWLCFSGANTSMKKELFYSVGGFDCNFQKTWGCEDIELGYRLNMKSTVKFVYDASNISFHLDHFRPNYLEEHKINMEYFLNKYGDKRLEYLSMYFQELINEKQLYEVGKK